MLPTYNMRHYRSYKKIKKTKKKTKKEKKKRKKKEKAKLLSFFLNNIPARGVTRSRTFRRFASMHSKDCISAPKKVKKKLLGNITDRTTHFYSERNIFTAKKWSFYFDKIQRYFELIYTQTQTITHICIYILNTIYVCKNNINIDIDIEIYCM